MGLFSAIASIFGGGNSGGATDSRIAIKGDISPIPSNMITPDYRPQNGVYIGTSADLLREWEAKKWMLSPEDLQRLKEMHATLQNYEKLSKEYGKELGKFSQTEAKLVRTVTGTIPKVAGVISLSMLLTKSLTAIWIELRLNIRKILLQGK